MEIQDKVIWITGASSGIGEALAISLSQSGAKLILSSRNKEKLQIVKNKCMNSDRHQIVVLDLENENEVCEIATKVCQELNGVIDILINNAGVSQRYLAIEGQFSLDKKILRTNLIGQIALTKTVLPFLVKRNESMVVATISILGLITTQTRTAYCASKHGLKAFFQSLRLEVYGTNLGILLVFPGYIKTNSPFTAITKDGNGGGKMDHFHERGISPEECAKAIVKGIRSNKSTIIVAGFRERLALFLGSYFPKIYNSLVYKMRID